MKALSMPISSPSRAESFPPPLMRFWKSNIGTKSRGGRSRSSPIFYMRKGRNSATVIEITQEPSSPKVTCIGQVKSKARKPGGAAVNRRPRRWVVKKALFSWKFSSRFYSQRRAFRRLFCKWGLFFRSGYCKKVDAVEDCVRVPSEKRENGLVEREFCSKNYEKFGRRIQESETEYLDDCSSSPPKNALILTRCRSAPYRTPSLGGRFWSSPLDENCKNFKELSKPICENEEISRMSQESSEKSGNSDKNDEDLKGILGFSVHPLLLTRCKSESARKGR